ncbi:hypothetical protein ACWTU6_30555 [Mesorhizobium sp. BHbsci]
MRTKGVNFAGGNLGVVIAGLEIEPLAHRFDHTGRVAGQAD